MTGTQLTTFALLLGVALLAGCSSDKSRQTNEDRRAAASKPGGGKERAVQSEARVADSFNSVFRRGLALVDKYQADKAVAEFERARTLATTVKQRAAALYQLGRLREAQADRTGAIAHYREAAKLSPDPEVHGRLAKLGVAVRDGLLVPRVLEGPLKAAPVADKNSPVITSASLPPSIQEVFVDREQRVVLKTRRGYFVRSNAVGGCAIEKLAPAGTNQHGQQIIRFVVDCTDNNKVRDGFEHENRTTHAFCSAGVSGLPSCHDLVTAAREAVSGHFDETIYEYEAKVRWKNGSVTVTPTKGKRSKFAAKVRAQWGKHELFYP